MRTKPTSAYDNIRIYYIIIAVNLLHVSVTFCGHLQGDAIFINDILQRQPSQCTNVKKKVLNARFTISVKI